MAPTFSWLAASGGTWPGRSAVKRRDRSQPLDFLAQVTAHIALRSSNFSEQFGAAVDNSNNVFQIPAPGKIIISAPLKSLEL
jgi:hypothetical protein